MTMETVMHKVTRDLLIQYSKTMRRIVDGGSVISTIEKMVEESKNQGIPDAELLEIVRELRTEIERLRSALPLREDDLMQIYRNIQDPITSMGFMSHYMHGRRWEEVAMLTNQTEAAVKKAVHRELDRLGIVREKRT